MPILGQWKLLLSLVLFSWRQKLEICPFSSVGTTEASWTLEVLASTGDAGWILRSVTGKMWNLFSFRVLLSSGKVGNQVGTKTEGSNCSCTRNRILEGHTIDKTQPHYLPRTVTHWTRKELMDYLHGSVSLLSGAYFYVSVTAKGFHYNG